MDAPEQSDSLIIPLLAYPFADIFPVSFSFAAVSDDEAVRTQYAAWGLRGHNGIDFALPQGTDVCACADGEIVHAGDNGGFGNCIIIRHPWGTSIYGHLQELKQSVGAVVQTGDIIGLSGKTGFVTGAHLHFGIKPTTADEENGYGGYIDPAPYLPQQSATQTTQEAQNTPLQQPPVVAAADQTPQTQPTSDPLPPPPAPVEEKEVIREIIRDVIQEVPESPEQQHGRMRHLKEKSKAVWEKKKNIIRGGILDFAAIHPTFTNADIRNHLHLPQSTVTRYLRDLVSQSKLRHTGKGRAITYSRT